MKFRNILAVYSEKVSETHLSTVNQIQQIIENDEDRECFSVEAKDLQNSVFENIDLVITVGGDGTFIRAASYLKQTPIIGINSESDKSEGYLTSINENQLDKLKEVLSGNYKINEKSRIKVIRNNVELDKLALNDVYIGSKNQFHTSKYIIKLNKTEEEHRSSGILISTPSGSTAWYESAGGKPFKEKILKFLVREPYFGRLFKPNILRGEINGKNLVVMSKMFNNSGAIVLDSDSIYEFNHGDLAELEFGKELNILIPK